RTTYFNVDIATCMSEAGVDDPEFLKAKCIKVISNGVKDNSKIGFQKSLTDGDFIVLFIGLCIPSKGILEFIEVVKSCHQFNPSIKGRIIGEVIHDSVSLSIKEGVDSGWLQY